MKVIQIEQYTVKLYMQDRNAAEVDEPVREIIYLNGGQENADLIWEQVEKPWLALAVISGFDWNADLSPWPAKKVFRQGEDFAGHAGTYLDVMTQQIMPQIEGYVNSDMKQDIDPNLYRTIAGYSLAGLFAVWAVYNTDLFLQVVSVSGSLWFDDFTEYMKQNRMLRIPSKAYLSVGAAEKKARNPRMSIVEQATAYAEQVLKSAGAETIFTLNEGGHFQEVEGRIVKGIHWITADISEY